MISRRIAAVMITGLLFCRPADSLSDPIDQCGWLWESPPGCVAFQSTEGGEAYATDLLSLPDSLRYTPIRIRGEAEACGLTCNSYLYCITGAILSQCEPLDLGCGVLDVVVVEGFCHVWISPMHGTLLTDFDGWADGDTVRAVGIIDNRSLGVCIMSAPILYATFSACPDSLSAVKRATWGTLKNVYLESSPDLTP